MLKIVLDTNMFLSAFLYHGMARSIFDLILDNKLTLYVSSDLKSEVLRKFKEFGASQDRLIDAIFFLQSKSITVVPTVKISVCRDPNDNFILELAQTCIADYIITRDRDLLDLPNHKWKETKIVKPEEFLPYLRSRKLI